MKTPNTNTKKRRHTGVPVQVREDYFLTTVTIPARYRAFFMHQAGQCFPGTVRVKGNTGYMGELIARDYDRACVSGEWERGE